MVTHCCRCGRPLVNGGCDCREVVNQRYRALVTAVIREVRTQEGGDPRMPRSQRPCCSTWRAASRRSSRVSLTLGTRIRSMTGSWTVGSRNGNRGSGFTSTTDTAGRGCPAVVSPGRRGPDGPAGALALCPSRTDNRRDGWRLSAQAPAGAGRHPQVCVPDPYDRPWSG